MSVTGAKIHFQIEDAAQRAEDIARLFELRAVLAIALAYERHNAIARLDGEISFLLRSECIRQAKSALDVGQVEAAHQLVEWAQHGVPRPEQSRFLDRVLADAI